MNEWVGECLGGEAGQGCGVCVIGAQVCTVSNYGIPGHQLPLYLAAPISHLQSMPLLLFLNLRLARLVSAGEQLLARDPGRRIPKQDLPGATRPGRRLPKEPRGTH